MSDTDEKNKKFVDDLHLKEEEELVETLARDKYEIPSINLTGVGIENEALKLIDEKRARELEVAPFNLSGKIVSIAVRAPARDDIRIFEEEIEKKGYVIKWFMASRASLEKAWARYEEISYAAKVKSGSLDVSEESLKKLADEIKSVEDVLKAIEEVKQNDNTHKVSRMLEIMIGGSIGIGASDIHLEPEETNVRFRMRIDGILQEILRIDYPTFKFLNSRIKLLAGMKLTTTQSSQDGRFSIWLDKDEISLRVSAMPGAYGESIVMRILNPKSIRVQVEELGMTEKLYKQTLLEIQKPNGLILITGPTGSGKTTTLYAFMQKIYSPEIKIITIEDPVEYHLPGLSQTQVEPDKGYTFFEGLKSALRQDPDVIMVGEIRDPDTAKTAVESALTGHLVFSTLHTNNAGGVVPRLIDLEVNPKILVSALKMSIAQRLVRKLCTECRKKVGATPEEETLLKKIIDDAKAEGKDMTEYGINTQPPYEIYAPVGCDKCNKTGYRGRIGIFEAILTDDAMEALIPQNPSEHEIKKVSEKQGILDMKEDGVLKILNGTTSLEEVKSVVDLEEE
ncbi:MAG TPA: GspE/PulE family protein [Candidatus Paceibacterota bacterium]|nr:GspE/PulE family protein [Candidatus Paceibacterota bacterium]